MHYWVVFKFSTTEIMIYTYVSLGVLQLCPLRPMSSTQVTAGQEYCVWFWL